MKFSTHAIERIRHRIPKQWPQITSAIESKLESGDFTREKNLRFSAECCVQSRRFRFVFAEDQPDQFTLITVIAL
ncbi:MAG: hypothetical protein NXI32_04030 [bacterium]|nr:hypothetical protein [bacterium]